MEAGAVTVVVGTFGQPEWKLTARRWAIRSAQNQTRPAEIIHVHGPNLAAARNDGAEQADTEWLCFLDADDELHPGYIEAMLAADGDLRQPNTQGYHWETDTYEAPSMIPVRPLLEANHLVIGTLVRRDMFIGVGGFDPTLPVLEDWDLWIRCWLAGADIVQVPDAIYIVHVNPGSRNLDRGLHRDTYQKIKRRYRKARRAA